jgi:hypothetical protein
VLDKRLSKTISFIFFHIYIFAPDMKHNVLLFKGTPVYFTKRDWYSEEC